MTSQDQFLQVIHRDEAQRRFHNALLLQPIGQELIPLAQALGRLLAADIVSPVDVPSFDRSNYDGFAVQASDTIGASEEKPRRLLLLPEAITPGVASGTMVLASQAVSIATGAMIPRGADAIVMVEHTDVEEDGNELLVRRATHPGFGISFTGTDITQGETVARQGELLTSRETGVLAAVGVVQVPVWKQVRVAIISTGDEIVAPGDTMQPGLVYDSNARILADAVRELGGEAVSFGIVRDDAGRLRTVLRKAMDACDVVLLSGGTSKGVGDLSYRAVAELSDPGIVAHGVALKPGKPICLAVSQGKPVVILPGFPTSAIFTFHEFVAPVIATLGGRESTEATELEAVMATKVNSDPGRTEYLLVGLTKGTKGLVAYPMGKGSGSVTTFSRADGFVTIDQHQEIIEASTPVAVRLLGRGLKLADLVVIGSHCVGLDFLLGQMQQRGWHTKFLAVGSMGGLLAAKREECDLAGIHLLDSESQTYNRPFLDEALALLPGYGRTQGVVFRKGDKRFEGKKPAEAIRMAEKDRECFMINRNQGSGTRILIDQILRGTQPSGYAVQARNHNAIAAAVLQHRADWGVAISGVVNDEALGFLPIADEQYDFVVPRSRLERPAVKDFARLLAEEGVREHLTTLGFRASYITAR